jgi:ATP-binding cassette subfamily B multidrug efflux pump
VLSLIGTDVTGIALPWLIKEGIDAAVQKKLAGLSLIYFPLLILLAAILQGFFRYCWRININGFSRKAEADLREKVFSHLQKLPLGYFQHNKTGDLMSRLTIDVQAVRELLGFGSLASIDAIITIIFSLACMIYIDPWLTFWSLLAMPMITVTVRTFGRHIFRWSHSVQEQLSDISAYVQENLAGMRVVQVYAQEDNQIRGFEKISAECMRKNMWLAILWGIFWPLMRVVSGIAATIVLWLGGRQVLQGSMSLGEFVAFNGYLGMLTWPLMAIGYVVNQYQRGTAALSRIGEVLDAEPSPRYDAAVSVDQQRARDLAVEFRDLTFTYGDNGPALKNITLAIPAGSVCAIVGETGSGKSTLANLLLRLYEPPSETIFINGVDITQMPPRLLTDSIGYVSQDIFLFSGSIRENILFGTSLVDEAAVEEASSAAQLLPAVQEFPGKFETIIGERGVRLSGGQKQRTALARAIIKNPPILILDDAFSSVDAETEEKILVRLRDFMAGRTTLLVSHRIATVRDADLIVATRSCSNGVAPITSFTTVNNWCAKLKDSIEWTAGCEPRSARRRRNPGQSLRCPFDAPHTALSPTLLEAAGGGACVSDLPYSNRAAPPLYH